MLDPLFRSRSARRSGGPLPRLFVALLALPWATPARAEAPPTTLVEDRAAAGAGAVTPAAPPADKPPVGVPPVTPPAIVPGHLAPESDEAAEAGETGAEAGAEEPAELLTPAEEPKDARAAFEQALTWAREGVKLERQGDRPGALKNLHDARIALLDAGLPEALQERGLSVLDCALGSELGRVDLEAMAQTLESYDEVEGGELAERDYVEREARRILANFGDSQPRPEDLQIFVDEVLEYIEYYRDKQRDFFERSYLRKHKYWPTIRQIFAAKKIPLEQGYMALVESGFNPLARSRADARGLWQFIPGTGRRYGLERAEDFYDVVRSTEAAAEYLLDLIGIFGSDSFLLATASYNAGEGRIMGCLRHLDDPFGGRSFWEIRGCLARETREYVPRIFAAVIIGSDPARFGFDLPSAEEQAKNFDVVVVPRPTRLSAIAAAAGTTVADLRAANSDLSGEAGSTPVRNFPLYVPVGKGQSTLAALQSLQPEPEPRGRVADDRVAGGESRHRVQRGETLSEIASRYRLPVAILARANHLRSPYRLQVGQNLRIPGGAAEIPPRVAERQPTEERREGGRRGGHRLTYTVQAGNSLQEIAELFAVQYRDLLHWNNLRSRTVKAGQELVVYPQSAYRLRQHTVRRGESPGEIARRYGVSTEAVLTANGLGRRAVIHPGAKLRVYVRG